MDLLIAVAGKATYQLIFDKSAQRPKLARPANAESAGEALKVLATSQLTVKAPSSWQALWKYVKPASSNHVLHSKADIQSALSTLVEEQRLFLIKAPTECIALSRPGNHQQRSFGAAANARSGSGTGGSGGASNSSNKSTANNKEPELEAVTKTQRSLAAQSSDKKLEAKESDDPALGNDQPESKSECRSDPVNMTTGEEMLAFDDAVLPGPMPFVLRRSYRSAQQENIGFGRSWSHSGSESLELEQYHVRYRTSEGRQLRFKIPRLGQQSRYLPEHLSLELLSEHAFVLKEQGQWDRVFVRDNQRQSLFRLKQLRHQAYVPAREGISEKGFCLNFAHNARGFLTRIDANWGRALLLNRNDKDQLSRIELLNSKNNKTRTLAEYDYCDDGNLIAHRNALGAGEEYSYQNNQLSRRTLATGFCFYFEWEHDGPGARCKRAWGDRGIYEAKFEWDVDNKISKVVDSRGYSNTLHYNDYGQIVKEIDYEGHEHQKHYQNGRLSKTLDPLGNKTHFFYDDDNNPVGMRDALGNRATLSYFRGRPSLFSDVDKAQWKRSYDSRGLLTKLVDPLGQQTRYHYNQNGLLIQQDDADGLSQKYRWGEQGELVHVIDSRGHKRLFIYDDWGRVEQVVASHAEDEQRQSVTSYRYTESDQVAEVRLPSGETLHYYYNDNDQLERFVDAQGRCTQWSYDGLSQVIERVDAEGQKLKYEYDTERNLTALINEKAERHEFFYDGNEKLVKEIGFDGRVQEYSYNAAGQLIKHLDAGEIETRFVRDALGRMQTKESRRILSEGGHGDEQKQRTRYAYDAKGRILECYNEHQFLSFEYNKLGRLIKEQHADINNNKIVAASKVDIEFKYQWPGLLSSIKLPGNELIQYNYDAQRQFQQAAYNGHLLTHIERDEFGRETERHQGALLTQSSYDPMGRLAAQQSYNKENKQNGPVQRSYGYDKFGRLSDFSSGDEQLRYVYDLVNRLQRVDGSEPELFYFDPASNLVSQEGQGKGRADGNRLTLLGDRKFSYDKRGNLIKENRGKEGKLETRYQYDNDNRLVAVEKQGQHTQYRYDPLGRRIAKTDAFGCSRFLWAGDQMLKEQRGEIELSYIYEPQNHRPLAMIKDGQAYHYHLDQLGTPRELSDERGSIVWKARYKSYGNLAVKEVDEVENNLRFQGQYFDKESGLHYNRHRYYDPSLGQFTTQDPIGLLGGVNNYQYAPNPIQWVDPLGLSCKEEPITDPSRLLQAPENLTPEMPGAPITSVILPAGFEFNQAVSPGQNAPGKFGTSDHIPDVDYVRNELAVIPDFKEDISGVRTVRVKRPVRAQISTVGPQTQDGILYPGGGSQIDVMGYDRNDPYVEFVGDERPIN
ncbi:RHS repeat-associated core domain-containing protein [Agaribacterium haliotis]|uniref:RHS repeat-associated core domain-containing protein n=1 Tax=Agaribacterium haliotis TaxID=2013869 RepID=UPI000BB53CBD|nr:RHS repeat-associated core domain-containing protein [Agaribacterium haliotis]